MSVHGANGLEMTNQLQLENRTAPLFKYLFPLFRIILTTEIKNNYNYVVFLRHINIYVVYLRHKIL